jgi:SNF family Na+-dependent transporter
MGITHMATFHSIMISDTSITTDTLVIGLADIMVDILEVILVVVTTLVFMAGEGGLNR